MLPLLAIIVEGKVRDRVVRADPEDDKYIAVAQEGLAQFIVSGDRHLLELAEYEGIRIVSPRAFLRELSG